MVAHFKSGHLWRALLRLVILLGCFFINNTVYALAIPAQPNNYINDYAHLLSPATVQALNAQQAAFEKKTTNQIVVAIFPSLENESLEDFTTRLEDQWKIGQKGKDNGILMTIFVKEHQVRIEVGYGLESVVTDAQAGDIIQRDIIPNFRTKNYDAGVSAALNDLMQLTSKADQPEPLKKAMPILSFANFVIFAVLIFMLIIFIVAYWRWQNTYTPQPVPKQEYIPRDSGVDLEQVEQDRPRRRGFLGILLFIITIILSIFSGRGGGSGGGGFGGGGGRSGGGGASGRW